MVSLANFIIHTGSSATLKHIASTSYDEDYSEGTPTYAESDIYILLQPLTSEDKKQLTGGVLDKARLKAYVSPAITIGGSDLIVVDTTTWTVLITYTLDSHIKLILGDKEVA